MEPQTTEDRPSVRSGRWFAAGITAACIGAAAVAVFAAWWFRETGGDCGVIRFYEQLFGLAIIAGWLVGSAVGIGIAVLPRPRSAVTVAGGTVLTIMVNILVILICIGVVRRVREDDYAIKDTQELLVMLAGTDGDARILAAHALAEQRAVEALPLLCAALADREADINLRLNAAYALGGICAPPRPDDTAVTAAVRALIDALAYRESFLPDAACQALGSIGDARAAAPLGALLADPSRTAHEKEDAARALGRIGGSEAQDILNRALTVADDDGLQRAIRNALTSIAPSQP